MSIIEPLETASSLITSCSVGSTEVCPVIFSTDGSAVGSLKAKGHQNKNWRISRTYPYICVFYTLNWRVDRVWWIAGRLGGEMRV